MCNTPQCSGNSRHLFIGLGGSGIAALMEVKGHFRSDPSFRESAERVCFLGIDSDHAGRIKVSYVKQPDGSVKTVEADALNAKEFLWLSHSNATQLIRPFMNPCVASWMDPQLIDRMRYVYLDGNGAAGTPQIGRLLLMGTVCDVRRRLELLVNEISADTLAPVHIHLFSGISGGTGAGCVVDLAYLIRDTIPEHMRSRFQLHGYILMPSTSTSTDFLVIRRGTAIGDAAMEQINRCMDLPGNGETYSCTYPDGRTVVSQQPLFDELYLQEGRSEDTVYANPREYALKCLVNKISKKVNQG